MSQSRTDPLPSWNDGGAKDAILDFVSRVTTDDSPEFVPVHEGVSPKIGTAMYAREMRMWTTLGRPDGHPSLGVIVHHTDGEREFAYDRQRVLTGQLDQRLDEAPRYGWGLADMKAE